MKKYMMLLVAMMLVVSFSGQAMAAFENGELIRVVWSTAGTNEIATDLGSVNTIKTATTTNYNFAGQGTFDYAALGAGADASNTFVTYFALNNTATKNAWLGGPAAGQTTAKSAFSGFATNAGLTTGNYVVAGNGATQVTLAMSDPLSFWNQLNAGGGGIGKMKGFVPAANAAQSLAAISTLGYVDQAMYYYSAPSGISGTSTGLNVSTIRTFADGHSELNAVATPIPAAFLLFGSGLLGLVGIRRKNAA